MLEPVFKIQIGHHHIENLEQYNGNGGQIDKTLKKHAIQYMQEYEYSEHHLNQFTRPLLPVRYFERFPYQKTVQPKDQIINPCRIHIIHCKVST